MAKRVKWAAARLAFMITAAISMLSGTLSAYILGPLYTWYFFRDLKFWKYRRLFLPVALCGWRLVADWVRDPSFRAMFSLPLTAPPMAGPDLSRVRVRPSWPQSDGACNGCSRCCVMRSCPMLDERSRRCISYGSFFWRYFNCGRYPENGAKIRFYECAKWAMIGEDDP
jgi:hypothetical protein